MAPQTLNQVVAEHKESFLAQKTVQCGQCMRDLNLEEAYYSPGGYPYCDKSCFDLFTED